ncbi:hypothetical protein AX14_000487 [Amanita brunnescens Koide BX004]|nr:hypothetical protein AX14_000487 [Amanita brunnescens Koide BX004]
MGYVLDKLRSPDTIISLLVLFVSYKLVKTFVQRRSNARLPKLKGPPNTDFLYGRLLEVNKSNDRGTTYADWAGKYGDVFEIPAQLGGRHIIIFDPKAIAHFLSKDTFTYIGSNFSKAFIKRFFGPNMIYAEDQDHFRQRRSLTPAFSNKALRSVTSVFYDSTYKVKQYWSAMFESSDEVVIDIQKWMNAITLDSIGIAGFNYDFKSIDGHDHPVNRVFHHFNDGDSNHARRFIDVIGPIFPFMHLIPSRTTQLFGDLKKAAGTIALELIKNSEKEQDGSGGTKDHSILGMLVKGRTEDASFKLLHQEVVSQWVIIELARKPEAQRKLREELRTQFANSDPTWDELVSGLPYLDAVAHESIRLHPPVEDVLRTVCPFPLDTMLLPIFCFQGKGRRRHPAKQANRDGRRAHDRFSRHSQRNKDKRTARGHQPCREDLGC